MLDGAAALEPDADELKSKARFGQSSDPFNQGRVESEAHGRHPTSGADSLTRRRGVLASRKVSRRIYVWGQADALLRHGAYGYPNPNRETPMDPFRLALVESVSCQVKSFRLTASSLQLPVRQRMSPHGTCLSSSHIRCLNARSVIGVPYEIGEK